MSTIQFDFFVPTESIPALIGYQGQKHKDSEKATNTKIEFVKTTG